MKHNGFGYRLLRGLTNCKGFILALSLAGCGEAIDRVEWRVMGTIAAVQARGGADMRMVRDVCQNAFSKESVGRDPVCGGRTAPWMTLLRC